MESTEKNSADHHSRAGLRQPLIPNGEVYAEERILRWY